MTKKILISTIVAASSLLTMTLSATAATVKVTVENLSDTGVFSPSSLFFHDGTFDTFTVGETASLAIKRQAEDGNGSLLLQDAMSSGFLGATAGSGPLLAGESVEIELEIEPGQNDYFSFASMFVPSNDAFLGNDNPLAYPVFNESGDFISQVIDIPRDEVWDSGTEFNDESNQNAAIPGVSFTPNTGVSTDEPVTVHPGYNSGGNFESLGFSFPADGSIVGRITIEEVSDFDPGDNPTTPEPTTTTALLVMGGLLYLKRYLQK